MPARVFLIRHGETEWSQGGKHASSTDVPLSKEGEDQVMESRRLFIGEGKLIDPGNVCRIYCSPRIRTRRTAELLGLGLHHHQYFRDEETGKIEMPVEPLELSDTSKEVIHLTEKLSEWKYGEYEGLTIGHIKQKREESGEHEPWRIWDQGCPGGESPRQVSDRLDELIADIQGVMKGTAASWPGGRTIPHVSPEPRDVVCVAHGHVLAALALRWVGRPLENGVRLLFDPAGIGILGFEHDDLEEPAILLGSRLQPMAAPSYS